MSENSLPLAKVVWENPETGSHNEHVLYEGANASIGRSPDNEIHVPHRVVSRHHASITYRSGVFVITDLDSANGVFVNDNKVDSYPLINGDIIRLLQPTLEFHAILPEDIESGDGTLVAETATTDARPRPRILFTSGSLDGTEVSIDRETITFGRAIPNATWEVALPDHAVSRPHARIYVRDTNWFLEDLGSSNGTMIEGEFISRPVPLQDGVTITMGETSMIFREEF